MKDQEVLFESHNYRFVRQPYNERTIFIFSKAVDSFGNTYWQEAGNRDVSHSGNDLAGKCIKELIGILKAADVKVVS